MFELIKGIQSVVETCMEIKPEERVLIITDTDPTFSWIAQLFMNVFHEMGVEVALSTIIPPETPGGHEPPASVAEAMKNVDVILCCSAKCTVVHTSARKEACAAGARFYAFCNTLTPIDDLKRGISPEDVRLLKERSENLAQRLTRANVGRLTTPSGTDITMSLAGREGLAIHPLGHAIGGLPDYAEAAIAPVEGTTEGVVVVDLAIPIWGYRLREPLRYTVKAGKVVDISSGCTQEAEGLRRIVTADENASNIAEFGIGTSHLIPWEIHGIIRDDARMGTAHIGLGRNNDIGGTTWSQIHVDTLMSQPTIELDGQCVLKDGVLLI